MLSFIYITFFVNNEERVAFRQPLCLVKYMPVLMSFLVETAAAAAEATAAAEDAREDQKDNNYYHHDPDPLVSEPEKAASFFIFSHVIHPFQQLNLLFNVIDFSTCKSPSPEQQKKENNKE